MTEVSGPWRGLDVLHGVGGEVASFNFDQRKLKYGKIWAEIHQNSEVLRSYSKFDTKGEYFYDELGEFEGSKRCSCEFTEGIHNPTLLNPETFEYCTFSRSDFEWFNIHHISIVITVRI